MKKFLSILSMSLVVVSVFASTAKTRGIGFTFEIPAGTDAKALIKTPTQYGVIFRVSEVSDEANCDSYSAYFNDNHKDTPALTAKSSNGALFSSNTITMPAAKVGTPSQTTYMCIYATITSPIQAVPTGSVDTGSVYTMSSQSYGFYNYSAGGYGNIIELTGDWTKTSLQP